MFGVIKIMPGEGLKHSLLSRCLYYAQRLVIVRTVRMRIASLIAAVIRARCGFPKRRAIGPDDRQLERQGLLDLGQLLSPDQCADIHAYLRGKTLSSRYGSELDFTIDNLPDEVGIAEYGLADIVNCPHILALANDEGLLGLAETYLGCKPTLSSLMLRWSFPAKGPAGNVQRFHRDADDWRYLKIMVYLTDVDKTDGPHVYVLGTHKETPPLRIRIESDEEVERRYGAKAVQTVIGTRGTGFAVDTAGVHKGEVPKARPRLMLQIQYSLLPSFAHRYYPQTYMGTGQFDSYVNRLFLA